METGEILVLFHFLPEDITTFVTAQRTSAAMRAGRRRSLFQESRPRPHGQTDESGVGARAFVQGKISCKLPPHSLNHMMAVQVTVALNGIDCIGLDPRHPSVQSALTMTYYRSPVLTRLWPRSLPTDGNAVLHLQGEFPSMVGVETVKVLVKQNGRSMVLDGRLEMGRDFVPLAKNAGGRGACGGQPRWADLHELDGRGETEVRCCGSGGRAHRATR